MDLRVLTWNVFHGRAVPGAGRELFEEFAAALDDWQWDVALLQEVPPWWLDPLRRTLGCEGSGALTAHSALLPIRRALAVRAPDLMRSAGGGANVILARSDRIVAARSALLCRRPERRRVHGVALAVGVWVSNLQTSTGPSPAAHGELLRAAELSREWAAPRRLPLILGGDLGHSGEEAVRDAGLRTAASSDGDRVLCAEGVEVSIASVSRLEHGVLSAHAPLAVTLLV